MCSQKSKTRAQGGLWDQADRDTQEICPKRAGRWDPSSSSCLTFSDLLCSNCHKNVLPFIIKKKNCEVKAGRDSSHSHSWDPTPSCISSPNGRPQSTLYPGRHQTQPFCVCQKICSMPAWGSWPHRVGARVLPGAICSYCTPGRLPRQRLQNCHLSLPCQP